MSFLSPKSYDVIVIGGCLSGLLASGIIAASGRRVALFEKRFSLQDEGSFPKEMHPGLKYSPSPPVLTLPQSLLFDLPHEPHTGVTSISLLFGYESPLLLGPTPQNSIRVFSSGDALRYDDFLHEMKNPSQSSFGKSAIEILRDYFDFEPLLTTLAVKACSTGQGGVDPQLPESGEYLRRHISHELAYPLVASRESFIPGIRRRAVSLGVDIFTGGGVREIVLKKNQVSGVLLANGMNCSSPAVVVPRSCRLFSQCRTQEAITDVMYIALPKSFLSKETVLDQLFHSYPGTPIFLNCDSLNDSPVLQVVRVQSKDPDKYVLRVSIFSPEEKHLEDSVISILDASIPGFSSGILGMTSVSSKKYITSSHKGLFFYEAADVGISGKLAAEDIL